MFTWICPDCGKEVDVSEQACPDCARPDAGSESKNRAPSRETLPTAASPRRAPAAKPAATQAVKQATRSGLEVRPFHLVLFVVVLVLAVAGAVWMSQPGMLSFENVPEEQDESIETFARGVSGPIEVGGVRAYYTDEFQTKVRAFVVNHSDAPQSVAIRVHLRVEQATEGAPPLASFNVVLPEPLEAHGAAEVDTALDAMGSLQSLPAWERVRVDVERL